jgi:pimeloyl-ACP methyl ester carboxylesterase
VTDDGADVRFVGLNDGRRLAYVSDGDPDGFPVVGLHGTPGCRLSRQRDDAPYKAARVRYIATDRAGYGQSTRHHGRTIADEASDIAELANALRLNEFGVVGASGGGPHALACAALLGDRVVRAACLVGIAPYGADGLERSDYLSGMDPLNLEAHEWAEAGEETLTREFTRLQAEWVSKAALDPLEVFADIDLAESDLDYLRRPEVVANIRRVVTEQAAHGVGGWVDDDLAFIRPWGFDVHDITAPTLVSYGEADVLSSPIHGEWLAAHVPGCVVHVTQGGHMPSDPLVEIAEEMAWLRDGIPPAGSR